VDFKIELIALFILFLNENLKINFLEICLNVTKFVLNMKKRLFLK